MLARATSLAASSSAQGWARRVAAAEQLPAAIETALGTDIDLACQTFEPEG